MAVAIAPSNFSTPSVGYGYELTDDAGAALPGGQNSVTLTGMGPVFVPKGILLFAITGQTDGELTLPGACYATYDENSIVKYTNTASGDTTIMTVDLYLSSSVKKLIIFVF